MTDSNSKVIFLKTVKEKAIEWNISPRHLQYLCKKGGIAGAVKKAGAWFIPDNAPIPLRYSKAGASHFHFVGTKKKIFDYSIELIKQRGFEAVSIKDIADAVGITQSSMYNHFKSKQEILDTIYDFYHYHYLKNRPTLADIEPILQNGSVLDMLKSTTYQFPRDYVEQMSSITSIIFYRCAIDERAKELKQTLMIDAGIQLAEEVFNRAIEIGRLAPFDTHALAIFMSSLKIYALHIWISDSSHETAVRYRADEFKLHEYAARLITDLKPPNGAEHSGKTK